MLAATSHQFHEYNTQSRDALCLADQVVRARHRGVLTRDRFNSANRALVLSLIWSNCTPRGPGPRRSGADDISANGLRGENATATGYRGRAAAGRPATGVLTPQPRLSWTTTPGGEDLTDGH